MAKSVSDGKIEASGAADHARRAFWASWITAAQVAGLVYVPVIDAFDWKLFDFLSTLDPPAPTLPRPIIVAIDQPSFSELAMPWPWPRGMHGELIEALRRAGAKVIALDILISEPGDPKQDQALAAAMGPDVVLAGMEAMVESEQISQVSRVEPLPALLDAGAGSGNADVTLDGDGVLRRMPKAAGSLAGVLTYRDDPANFPDAAIGRHTLIQYLHPATGYPQTYSYYQALDPENSLPPGVFKDRVVLVGLRLGLDIGDQSGPDRFFTSHTQATGRSIAGVEVQATIFENLREGLYIQGLPDLAKATVAALVALAFGHVNRRFTTWRTLASLLIGIPAVLIAGYFALRYGRVWTGASYPAFAVLLSVGVQAVLGTITERQARRRIMNAFGHYLAPAMVEQLARDPDSLRLGGEVRELTVMFCDLRGFTTISEQFKDQPRRLTYIINRALTVLTDELLATGATIDKYIGDCVMAFWNAPLDDPLHAKHAAEAAKRMIVAIDKLNGELGRQAANEGWQMPTIGIGIGINTGDAVVGNMGSDRRFDYSALGDTVNLASRLESLSKTYGEIIIVSEATSKRIAKDFPTRRLDRVQVKGRSEPVTIYTIGAEAIPQPSS